MATNMVSIIERAREQLIVATGLKTSSTLSIAMGEKGWLVNIEMVEKESIPNQMDLLAIYETQLDEDGNLMGFKRMGMRKRMDVVS